MKKGDLVRIMCDTFTPDVKIGEIHRIHKYSPKKIYKVTILANRNSWNFSEQEVILIENPSKLLKEFFK